MITICFKYLWGNVHELFYENNKNELHRDDGYAYYKIDRPPYYYQKETVCTSFTLKQRYSAGFLHHKKDVI